MPKKIKSKEWKWSKSKKLNYNKMPCSSLALMWKVSKDQGDKKSMDKIANIYIKRKCMKKNKK